MTEAVKTVTFIDIMFVILLMLSGSIGGWQGDVIYYTAFVLAVILGTAASDKLKHKREEQKGLAEDYHMLFGLDKKRFSLMLPLIAPIVVVVFLTSFVSSIFLSLFGVVPPPVEDDGIFKMLFAHAVLPAVLEELIFRYIPLLLLKPYSKRWCVIYSAICFALIHCSLAQMPYAFVAGIVFMLVDIAFDSVLPSLMLHFINNAASVIWIKYCSSTSASLIFIAALVFLAAVSLVFILRRKNEYASRFTLALESGEKMPYTYAPIILAAICLCVAFAGI